MSSMSKDSSGQLTEQLAAITTTTVSGTTLTGSVAVVTPKLNFSGAPADVYAAAMTIDVTKSSHFVAGSNATSATVTFTPSAAGTKGDLLTIITTADAGGTVTATFASTFRSSGTQATTANKASSALFMSNGVNWIEIARTTALT